MISESLKRKLMAAASAGSIASAGVLVSRFEPGKIRGEPYVDPVGVLAVCDGHTGPDINPNRVYTDAWRDADPSIADRGAPLHNRAVE